MTQPPDNRTCATCEHPFVEHARNADTNQRTVCMHNCPCERFTPVSEEPRCSKPPAGTVIADFRVGPCGKALPCPDHPAESPKDAVKDERCINHFSDGSKIHPNQNCCATVKAEPGCAAGSDGDCNAPYCPQLRDGEPQRSGRHCPLDWRCADPECDGTCGECKARLVLAQKEAAWRAAFALANSAHNALDAGELGEIHEARLFFDAGWNARRSIPPMDDCPGCGTWHRRQECPSSIDIEGIADEIAKLSREYFASRRNLFDWAKQPLAKEIAAILRRSLTPSDTEEMKS